MQTIFYQLFFSLWIILEITKQYRFFEISRSDWDFLEKHQKAKNEYNGWIEVHESYLNLETRFIEYLNDHNLLLKNNIVDIKDIKKKKKLSDDLKNIQKELQWIPSQIEDIKLWLKYNNERAANIN